MPEERKAGFRRTFQQCAHYLADQRLFEDMAQPAGYYPTWPTDPAYWSDLAYKLRDPDGIADHDLGLVAKRRITPELQDDLTEMVTSGNPQDLMKAGNIVGAGMQDDEQRLQGAAWNVAACRLGATHCVSSYTSIGSEPASFEQWAQANMPAASMMNPHVIHNKGRLNAVQSL